MSLKINQSIYPYTEQVKNFPVYLAGMGGTVIITNRSGVKDKYNKCIMEQLPTVYRKLVGAYVEEYDPMGWDNAKIEFTDGTMYNCRQ